MDKEEVILCRRIEELARRSYEKGIYTFTDFLDLAGQNLFFQIEKEVNYAGYSIFGGNEDCDRKMIMFGHDQGWQKETEFPISCVKIEPNSEKFGEELGHRDYLGALMNLGLERSVMGDIFLKEKSAYVFCHTKIVPFIIENLVKVRHTFVKCTIVSEGLESLCSEKKEISVLCPSERIDVVISRVYHCSRSQSSEWFRSRKVYVNSKLNENNSYQLKPGDIVTVRGKGKFKYSGILGTTKKDKLSLKILLYI